MPRSIGSYKDDGESTNYTCMRTQTNAATTVQCLPEITNYFSALVGSLSYDKCRVRVVTWLVQYFHSSTLRLSRKWLESAAHGAHGLDESME